MIGRWGLYSDLMRELRAAGFTLEDASRAALVAERAVRERRDHFIRLAASGSTIREIASVWGLSKSAVGKICACPPIKAKVDNDTGHPTPADKPASVQR